MSNTPRPTDFVMPAAEGVDVVMMIDNTVPLTQSLMIKLINGTKLYMRSIFTANEARTLVKNNIWWNTTYAQAKLTTIPEPFQMRGNQLFIHYYPSKELLDCQLLD